MKKIHLYIIIFALMIILAATCYDWGGIFIAEGVLAGVGLFVGVKLDEERNARKEREKKEKEKKSDSL